jgi:hypothetical protein
MAGAWPCPWPSTILPLKGFNVVGSIENPPTKPRELERAVGGLG